MDGTYLLLSIVIPLLGSIAIWLTRGKIRDCFALLVTIPSFIFTCLLISPILKGKTIETAIPFLNPKMSSLFFLGDSTSLIFAIVFSLLGSIAVIYSIDYMKTYTHQTEFYSMTVLMLGSLMGIAYTRNLLILYIFWEIAALTTWRLVGFHRGKEETLIANKTLLIIFAGSSLMLLGFLLIYADAHTFDLVKLKDYSPSHFILFLIFIGIIAKAAVLPIHTWLPDAHTVAPSPISALLSGIVVKIGIFAFVRIFCWTFHETWHWILFLAVISSIVAASGALLETDMKKIIAYSTVSQSGYILLGFAVWNEIGMTGGLLYFMVHAISKAGLFLCAGIVEQKCHERNILNLGGLMKSMPVTGISFAFCALSIIGMPPFGGFYSKLMVIIAMVKEGNYWIASLAIFAAILTLLYLFRLFNAVFLGKEKFSNVREGSKLMTSCVLFLGIATLIIGLSISPILKLINVAVTNVFQ